MFRELGLQPTYRVPEPNTWREILATIDREHVPIAHQTVGLLEYGLPNASLVAGLEARGAHVVSVKVYRYDLPLDVLPLEANVRAIAAGEIDVAMFTSAHQVVNLLRVAEQLQLGAELHAGLARTVVVSIGPTTSETLGEFDIQVDIEPEHPKMGQLVAAAAAKAPGLAAGKRGGTNPSTRAATNPVAGVSDPGAPRSRRPHGGRLQGENRRPRRSRLQNRRSIRLWRAIGTRGRSCGPAGDCRSSGRRSG